MKSASVCECRFNLLVLYHGTIIYTEWLREYGLKELIVGFDRQASRAKFVARLEDKPEGVPWARRGRSQRAAAEFFVA